jgi:hypothetical protein
MQMPTFDLSGTNGKLINGIDGRGMYVPCDVQNFAQGAAFIGVRDGLADYHAVNQWRDQLAFRGDGLSVFARLNRH